MPSIPDDDGVRQLTLADPDDPTLTHLAVVGDTYTVLVRTQDTAGKYCLIDMLIPAGGGPPPHRHDFDEMFHVLDGTVEVTVRDATSRATTGQTVNIPANAPHRFHNPGDSTLRLLCLTAPGGLDEYFARFGDLVSTRTSAAPKLTEAELGERLKRAAAAADEFHIDMLGAGGDASADGER
jgi:mannose-6-phosphate isomerase-like protein (cupin superfamily)